MAGRPREPSGNSAKGLAPIGCYRGQLIQCDRHWSPEPKRILLRRTGGPAVIFSNFDRSQSIGGESRLLSTRTLDVR